MAAAFGALGGSRFAFMCVDVFRLHYWNFQTMAAFTVSPSMVAVKARGG